MYDFDKRPDPIAEYVEQAYRYYVTADNTMSDYEWDMLAKYIEKNWDKLESPYKKFLNPEDGLFSAHHLKWDAMKAEGLLKIGE